MSDRKDVVTVSGSLWNNDTKTVANALNINAYLLKEIFDRIERLEKENKELMRKVNEVTHEQ